VIELGRDKAAQKTEIDREVKRRSARYPAAYILGDLLCPPLYSPEKLFATEEKCADIQTYIV
jgi:hypothetical protein